MPNRIVEKVNNLWLIAYINSKYIKDVGNLIAKYTEYENVKAYIPTVTILKKTFKKENIFEEVPLLFNYGFFSIPKEFCDNAEWLSEFRRRVPCVYAWVRDAANSKNKDGFINVAVADGLEIAYLQENAPKMGAHAKEDIKMLRIGELITLRGYPFEGVSAKVLEIEEKLKRVRVEIQIFGGKMPLLVSFDNVFFTIYQNEDNYTNSSLGDVGMDGMDPRAFDKLRKSKIRMEHDGY